MILPSDVNVRKICIFLYCSYLYTVNPRFTMCLDLPGLLSFTRILHDYSKT